MPNTTNIALWIATNNIQTGADAVAALKAAIELGRHGAFHGGIAKNGMTVLKGRTSSRLLLFSDRSKEALAVLLLTQIKTDHQTLIDYYRKRKEMESESDWS